MNISFITKNTKGPRKILLIAVMVFLLHGFLTRTFHLSQTFNYAVEFFSLFIWFCKPFQLKKTKLKVALAIIIVMSFFALIGVILNQVAPMNVLMGFRGQIMPMALCFGAAAYLTVNDYHRIFGLFYKFQWLNLACTLIQFFVYGLTSDYNNGAFTGGAEQNFFCSILIAYYFYAYNNKLATLRQFLFILISSFTIAILQDEKFIFIAVILILINYLFNQKISFRNIIGILLLSLSLIFALRNLDDSQSNSIGSIDNAIEYSQTAGLGYGFPRIGSSSLISEMFFDSPVKKMFGLGLGTGTENKAPGVDLSFSYQYGGLCYFLFTFQNVFLQTGWLGIITFVSFFVYLYIYNRRWKQKSPYQYKWLYDVAISISLITILIIWYNGTLRVYYAVLPYIILGLGPCLTKSIMRKNEK